jgi:D-Tyr-tRNAtyr deacylase
MSGSLEVRNFLMQHDTIAGNGAGFTGGVPAQRTGETSRVTEEQIRKARLAVARGALGAEDCRLLLDMLGLAPGDDGAPPVSR